MPKYSTTETFTAGSTATGTQTGVVTLNERTLTGFIVSASTITGTKVTFLVSTDAISFYPLYDSDSSEVSLTVTSASRAYNLKPSVFLPWDYIKARLGTSASAVAQATYSTGVEFVMDPL
jgi:hemolysin activation/secretion protein